MSFKFVRQLPSPDQVKEQTPMSEEMKKIKEQRDRLIQDVITGDSDKFLVIVGPCSADNEDSVCEYTNRLAKVQEKVADGSIPTSPGQQEKDIKACSISRTLRPSQMLWQEFWPSVTCICVPWKKPA